MSNKQLLNEGSSSRGDMLNSPYVGRGSFSGVWWRKKKVWKWCLLYKDENRKYGVP